MAESKIVLPDLPGAEYAPEPPPQGPIVWMKENLFSTPFSVVLTIIGSIIAVGALRGVFGFVANPERIWQAVTTNLRLLMVQAYPDQHMWRVWVSIGVVVVLTALSLAVWRVGGRTSGRKLTGNVMALGGLIAIIGLVAPFPFEMNVTWTGLGLALAGIGYMLRRMMGDRAKIENIPILAVVAGLLIGLVASLWVLQVPVPDPDTGIRAATTEPLANTTRFPWMFLLIAGFVAYGLGTRIRNWKQGRPLLVAAWALSYPVIFLHILRGTVLTNVSEYLLIGGAFLIIGAAVIYALVNLEIGESGRLIAGVLLIAALATWATPTLIIIRLLLLILALFALAAPTFGGSGGSRYRYIAIYAVTVVVMVYLMLLATCTSLVQTQSAVPFGGFMITWLLAIGAVSLSFPIGVVLALARTSSLPLFRVMATIYIELVRGVPLITWLLMSVVVFPFLFPEGVEFEDVVKVLLFFTFFSAAYLAENVRGGLQAVSKGQQEASNALGMSTMQRTAFITLPQALRAVIPALVGQVIATFKDTSLVAIVGLFDILLIAKNVVPNQSQPFNFLGSIKENLVVVALVYWIFTFIFSRVSQRIERNLGVGER